MPSTTWPAMTMREARQAVRDIEDLRHWTERCWCEREHEAGTAGLVAPPWAAGEDGGNGR